MVKRWILRALVLIVVGTIATGIWYWKPLVQRITTESKDKIQAYLSDSLGSPVELGAFEVKWDWVLPEIIVHGLKTPLYQVRAEKLSMRLHLRESFKFRQLRVGSIQIHGFQAVYSDNTPLPVWKGSGSDVLAVGMASLFELQWIEPRVRVELKKRTPWRLSASKWTTQIGGAQAQSEVQTLRLDMPQWWSKPLVAQKVRLAVSRKDSSNVHVTIGTAELDPGVGLSAEADWNTENSDIQGTLKARSAKIDQWLEVVPNGWLTPDVRVWLETHVSEAGLKETTVDFGRSKGVDRFQIKSDLQLGVFEFDPSWPNIKNALGTVEVTEKKVRVVLKDAMFAEESLSGTTIELVDPFEEVTIQSDWETQGERLEQFFIQTPLGKPLEPVFEALQWSGKTAFSMQLHVPIGDDIPVVTGSVDVQDAAIALKKMPIQWSALKGELRWDGDGLNLGKMQAQWNGNPVQWDGKVALNGKAAGETKLGIKTRVSSKTLENILKRPLPWMKGAIDVDSTWLINSEGVRSNLKSALVGAAIDLPKPFQKAISDQWPTTLEFFEKGTSLDSLSLRIQGLVRRSEDGELKILKTLKRLQVVGKLGDVSVTDWKDFLDRTQLSQDGTSERTAALDSVEVDVVSDVLTWNQYAFPVFKARGSWSPAMVKARVMASDVDGSIEVPLPAKGNWLQARFSKLILPEFPRSSVPQGGTPLPSPSPVTYVDWPSLDIVVDRLRVGPQLFGRAVAQIEKSMDEFQIKRAEIQGPELSLRVNHGRAHLGQEPETELSGEVLIKQTLFPTRFEKLKAIELGSGQIVFDLKWPAGPEQFALKHLTGSIRTNVKQGVFRGIESGAATAFNFLSYANDDTDQKILRFSKGSADLKFVHGEVTFQQFRALMGTVFTKVRGQASATQETYALEARVTPMVEDFDEKGEEPGNLLSHTYTISGPWSKPSVKLKIF